MNHARAVIVAVTASTALLLAGCSDTSGPEKKPASASKTDKAADEPVDCADDTLTVAEWTENCATGEEGVGEAGAGADEEPAVEDEAAAPDTELKLGETAVYDDGVELTVTKIVKLTAFGEFDMGPEPGQTGFRIHLQVKAGDKPLDLEEISLIATGASKGGDATPIMVEAGSKPITGRIAAGTTTTKTDDYAMDDQYGTIVAVTASYYTDDFMWETDPTWTGDIG